MASTAADAALDVDNHDANITLRIRHRDETTFDLQVNLHDTTVGSLKQQVNDSSYVRLIAAGRLLAPDTATLADFKLHDMDVIHAVITDPPPNHRKQGVDDCEDEEEGVYYANENDDIEAANPTMRSRSSARLPLGFDRLRSTVNLRTTEINILRSYFNDRIDAWLSANENVRERIQSMEPNDALRRRRLQEDAWMTVQSDTSEFAMNVTNAMTEHRFSTTRQQLPRTRSSPFDFVLGLNLGYFIGYYMLVFMWVPSIPQRQKAGILAGYMLRVINGVAHPNDELVDEYLDDAVYGGD